ncbi:hypothetical protein [Pseudonocardia sp. TRM90224]|uniref:hypothetical protein n=1 Tax=Pseudonocardia sp. TRM90224 TaxID=2812678 RepID=UPI001E563A29|nr:hypothetical protein [Pseudonocardia sp. TRM90224]
MTQPGATPDVLAEILCVDENDLRYVADDWDAWLAEHDLDPRLPRQPRRAGR